MATGRYLSEVAARLVERGHTVTVVTSRRAYDRPEERFARFEMWRGVRIIRVFTTGFGKSAPWRRAADFASFLLACSFRLLLLPRHEVVVALTTPPLISFIGAWLARLRGSRFVYWVMDFNPDEAIAAGWLRTGSPATWLLERCSRFSLRHAHRIIALDRFMRDRIAAKGIPLRKICVLPPWSQDDTVRFDDASRKAFRARHGLEGKFVVMYSGNHSPVHPLDTLLEAASRLASEKDIVFCFVGGGSEWRKIKAMAEDAESATNQHPSAIPQPQPPTLNPQRPNLLCLPYQPWEELSECLSAADLHVIVMGAAFVGLVHPCKIYNILRISAPVLYIGPTPSHVSEILDQLGGQYPTLAVRPGEVEPLVRGILALRQSSDEHNRRAPATVISSFSKESVLPQLVAELESA